VHLLQATTVLTASCFQSVFVLLGQGPIRAVEPMMMMMMMMMSVTPWRFTLFPTNSSPLVHPIVNTPPAQHQQGFSPGWWALQ